MLLQHLFEARRNPELNPRERGSLVPYLKGHYYVSFTDIPKIGLNPNLSWTTPAGVYAYPLFITRAEYWVQTGTFPFAGFRDYANILLNRGNELMLSDVTEQHLNSVAKKYMAEFDDKEMLDYILEEVKGDKPAVAFWTFTAFYASARLIGPRPVQQNPQSYRLKAHSFDREMIVKWNFLLRELGWDTITDDVGNVIHMLETYQTVFLNPKAIGMVDRINNPYKPRNSMIGTPKHLIGLLNTEKFNPYYLFRNTLYVMNTLVDGVKYSIVPNQGTGEVLGKACYNIVPDLKSKVAHLLPLNSDKERVFFRAFVMNAFDKKDRPMLVDLFVGEGISRPEAEFLVGNSSQIPSPDQLSSSSPQK